MVPISQKRSRIIVGAARVVALKGPSASVTEIVREARITRKTFYNLFEGREDCLRAVVEMAGTDLLSVLWGAVDPEERCEDRVAAGVLALVGYVVERPELSRAYLLHGPTIAPDFLEEARGRFAALLNPESTNREYFLVTAIEHALHRNLIDDAGEPAAQPFIDLILAQLHAPERLAA